MLLNPDVLLTPPRLLKFPVHEKHCTYCPLPPYPDIYHSSIGLRLTPLMYTLPQRASDSYRLVKSPQRNTLCRSCMSTNVRYFNGYA